METTIKSAIYIHAFFGGIGLLAGFASVIFQKGSSNHKKAGKLFSISMIISSVISLIVCLFPKHENPFLFLIGIFTIYLVVSGNRVLLFKNKKQPNYIDKLISKILLIGAITQLILGCYYLLNQQFGGILYLFFGTLALSLSIRDFKFFKSLDKSKILNLHIGKMSGAFAASITAFLVAGIQLQNIIFWILPTLLAGIFIFYWIRKVNRPKKVIL